MDGDSGSKSSIDDILVIIRSIARFADETRLPSFRSGMLMP